jgi:fructose-specific phosphotransferase system IIA component
MKKGIEVMDYLDVSRIVDLDVSSKKEALSQLIEVISASEEITDPDVFAKAIFAREKLMSTGIGYHIAIPHARDKSVKDFVIAVGRCKQGLEYESIDDQPVNLIFMIGASDKQDKDYIKLLSKLMLRLKKDDLLKRILKAETAEEIYQILLKED